MTLWVDAQLSPRTAHWIAANFPITAAPLRDLGLRDASDEEIFAAARTANAIVLTKDSDFVRLLEQQGSPPKVIWLTCGNTSDAALQQVLTRHLTTALGLLAEGEDLVEIGSP
jgi:predicted nuclease of predicted toxin-antitoxin system